MEDILHCFVMRDKSSTDILLKRTSWGNVSRTRWHQRCTPSVSMNMNIFVFAGESHSSHVVFIRTISVILCHSCSVNYFPRSLFHRGMWKANFLEPLEGNMLTYWRKESSAHTITYLSLLFHCCVCLFCVVHVLWKNRLVSWASIIYSHSINAEVLSLAEHICRFYL